MIALGPLFAEVVTLTQGHFDRFAKVSGDDNPIHVDRAFPARTRFGRTVSHGMLLYTVLWGLVRRHAPGYSPAEQTLMFPAPAYADDPLTFFATVVESDATGAKLDLIAMRISDDAIVCDATCRLIPSGVRP